MSDLTEDAKAEIAAAFKIVREDKHHAMLRTIAKNTTPKEPTPPVEPPVVPPTPPTPPTPPVVEPPPPKPPVVPPTPPAVEKRRSAYWGDLDD